MSKISIIVPVYNVEKYLSRCVDSILAQSFTDFELILVDDGSPDNCPQICDEYAVKDSRIRVIHKKNGGVSAARNSGLEIVQGEYVTFCDSDDYVTEDWLQKMYETIIKTDADCVGIQYTKVNDNGELLSKSTFKIKEWNFSSCKDNVEYIVNELFREDCGWELCFNLYKASIIKKHNIKICETCSNFAEDLNFTLKYSLHCKKMINLKDYCYFYVQHEGSMMNNSKGTVKLDALNEVSKDFGNHFFAQRYSQKIKNYFPLIHFLIMYNQFIKIISYPVNYDLFISEISKINDKEWFKKYINKILWQYKLLKKYYGDIPAQRLIVFSRFLFHQNKFLYKYERAVYYKFFYKE